MAVCALELISGAKDDKTARTAGLVSLVLVACKSVLEAATGRMFLAFLHPDLLGIPIAVSHLGGVLAGCGNLAAAECKRNGRLRRESGYDASSMSIASAATFSEA